MMKTGDENLSKYATFKTRPSTTSSKPCVSLQTLNLKDIRRGKKIVAGNVTGLPRKGFRQNIVRAWVKMHVSGVSRWLAQKSERLTRKSNTKTKGHT